MERYSFTYNGKRHDVRAKDTQDLIQKVISKVEKSAGSVTNDVSFSDLCEEFLVSYKLNSSADRTYSSYKQRINKHLLPAFGGMYVDNLTHAKCQRFVLGLNGYSQNYISKIYNDLHQILDMAVKIGLIDSNPSDGVVLPSGGASTRRAITDSERKCILKVAKTHPAGLYVLLMLYCGLRPHETALIQGKDLKNYTLHVRGTKNKDADRYVPVPEALLKTIPNIDKEEYLIKSLTGKSPVTEVQRNKMWKSFKREMNIRMGCTVYRNQLIPPYPVADDLVAYCLRHTFCTDLQDAGVPINIARHLMGHSTIHLTSKIYTHMSDVSFDATRRSVEAYQNSSLLPRLCHTSGSKLG